MLNPFLDTLIGGTISCIISGIIVGIILKIRWNRIFLLKKITRALEKYEKIKLKPEKEKKLVRKIGQYFDNGLGKLKKMGFSIIHIQPGRLRVAGEPVIRGDSIEDNNFGIHLTRKYPDIIVKQFLIRRLLNGKKKDPDEAYFSEGYPESKKENSVNQVLYDFIEHLKNKSKFSKIFNFLRIKKRNRILWIKKNLRRKNHD